MTRYMVALAGALISLGVIIELLRRRQLREKYSVLWLLVGTGVASLTLFPGVLEWLSRVAGVAVPANLLFFAALVLLLSVSVHLSWEISRLEADDSGAWVRAELDWSANDVLMTG